ncbi:MAG: efflux RND transporter periplasmic adaptor subunit [Candidatus Acidiferrales bacterium]|jgi:HlyD family secretion protein
MAGLTKRTWTILSAILILIVLVVVTIATRDRPPDVQVVRVTHDDLEASITSNGKIEPINAFVFRAEFPTYVSEVSAKEGQSVRRGDKILRLDDADIESQLAAVRQDLLTTQSVLKNARAGGSPDQAADLQGQLSTAQARVASLEKVQKSLRELFAKQAATQAELDQNSLDLDNARTNLRTLQEKKAQFDSQAGLDVERLNLHVQQDSETIRSLEHKVRSATVISPVDGTLYSLPVRAGDYVSIGQELAQMADLRRVQVRVFVDEPDLSGLEPGQAIRITWDAMPSHEWTGHTEQIPKQVVARGTRNVGEVLCSVDNDKLELIPNTNVGVTILLHRRNNVLAVSRAAVVADGPRRVVYLVDDDRLHQRQIAVGIASASKYEIVSGLADGDRVALSGDFTLQDGMKVHPVDAK